MAIVDGGEGDNRDVRTREHLSDFIVFSAELAHVCGKLADERPVVSLMRKRLSSTGECKSERLMIIEDSEQVSLIVVTKVFYCEEDGQQFAIKSSKLLLSVGEFPGKKARVHPIRSRKCSNWPPTALSGASIMMLVLELR